MTQVLQADDSGVARAAALLRAGELVAFGTETVYGLGADATDGLAVASVFKAKGRPRFNPLICHYASADDAFAHVRPNATARHLAGAFWPGPLTLVLERRADCPVHLLAGAGGDTLAVRVPAHPVAHALVVAVGRPVAAPSANRSGGVSPTEARHVLEDLGGRIAAVLDCGPAPVGVESTVLDLAGAVPRLLRPGGVPEEALTALVGPLARGQAEAAQALRSPGQLLSHYAPRLPLRLDAETVGADEALLAFGPQAPTVPVCWNLSTSSDLAEAASRLFAGLRWLDEEGRRWGLAGIAAVPIPARGLGAAIRDRLRRAAAPRSLERPELELPNPVLPPGASRSTPP